MKRFTTSALAAFVMLLGVGVAQAAVVVANDWVVLSTGNGAVNYGDGGEFQVSVYGPGSFSEVTGSPVGSPVAIGSFYTFCGDTAHVFVPGKAYKVTGVDSVTSSMTPAGKSLYYQYWNQSSPTVPGALAGYVPGHAALASNSTIGGIPSTQVAGALQAEIWTSLGQTLPSGYPWASLVSAAEGVFDWAGNTVTVPDDAIEGMTLWGPNNNYGYGDPGQTQLYAPPTISPSPSVPEPATMIVWGLLGTASWLGMRIRRRLSVDRHPC